MSCYSDQRFSFSALLVLCLFALSHPIAWGQVQRNSTTGLFELNSTRFKLITDLPIDDELVKWPEILDQAVAHWKVYFGAPRDDRELSTTVHLIRDLARFQAAGLLRDVPPFDEGYQYGDRLFLREQPTPYYRRHLFLHEATHWYMWHVFGGGGSPWYMEGMADLQATHAWENETLRLGILPGSPLQVPYWGRLKAIHETLGQGKAPSLGAILAYENDRDRTIRYSWSWAACVFFANHPKFGPILQNVRGNKLDYSEALSRKLKAAIGEDWNEALIDWSGFISDFEFGYDPQRSLVESGQPKNAKPLAAKSTMQLRTDRGWQSAGITLEKGQAFRVHCKGRYVVRAKDPNLPDDRDWESESQGITIEYYRERPLGCVLASVQSAESNASTNRWETVRVGQGIELQAETAGLLFLKINEASGKLSDNRGTIDVSIEPR
jgi:hypothetical protein